MRPLRLTKDLLLALHGGAESRHLAAGFALGAALGLVPKDNLLAAGFFLLFFLFNVDQSMALLSTLLFTAFGFGLDPVAHGIGWALLKAAPLRGLWTWLYGLPIVPLTRFNNTVVLGNLVLGALLFFPLYYGSLKGFKLYDAHLRARIEASAVVRAIKQWQIYQLYLSCREKYRRWLA
jgi:uncharacterized protein (TIGR03546 family)